MSEWAHHFELATVLLPFRLDERLMELRELQQRMVRTRPEAFTREEWGYLIAFLDERHLLHVFTSTFGPRLGSARSSRVLRGRGTVAVWLPNNVSLLGPLTLILLALTGNVVRAKAGARADDLASEFVTFTGNTMFAQTDVARFDRHDARNREMSAWAAVRIAFGNDESVRAIAALPHPSGSLQFSFGDRVSEAWLDPRTIDDEIVVTLAKVFAVYGQTGCTSPRRVVLPGSTLDIARGLRDRLVGVWPRVVRNRVPMYVASRNVLAAQTAAAYGWESCTAGENAAAVAVGGAELPLHGSPFLLSIVAADLETALATMPKKIQTIGHNFPIDAPIVARLIDAGAKRIVPLAAMHHFGVVWDGFAWWRATFEEIEVST